MKTQFAKGFVPFEPKDKVKLFIDDEIYIIEEILFIQYLAARRAEFQFKLSLNGSIIDYLFPLESIKERVL